VKHDQTGWLVPPRNPPALAAAILDALRDQSKAKRLACNGQKLTADIFDVIKTASQVATIYERILSARTVAHRQGRLAPFTATGAA